MEDIMKIFNNLAEAIKNETKERNNQSRSTFLMQCSFLPNFEIQKYYQNQPKFSVVFSRSNLRKIKNGSYIISFDAQESVGTHWGALYANAENLTYFDSFGAENISKEIIYSLAQNSIMCGQFFVELNDFIIKVKVRYSIQIYIQYNKYK